jgi:hypothetical protein
VRAPPTWQSAAHCRLCAHTAAHPVTSCFPEGKVRFPSLHPARTVVDSAHAQPRILSGRGLPQRCAFSLHQLRWARCAKRPDGVVLLTNPQTPNAINTVNKHSHSRRLNAHSRVIPTGRSGTALLVALRHGKDMLTLEWARHINWMLLSFTAHVAGAPPIWVRHGVGHRVECSICGTPRLSGDRGR